MKYNLWVDVQNVDELTHVIVQLARTGVEFGVVRVIPQKEKVPATKPKNTKLEKTTEQPKKRRHRRISDGRSAVDVIKRALENRGPLAYAQLRLVLERAKFAPSSLGSAMERARRFGAVEKRDRKYHLITKEPRTEKHADG